MACRVWRKASADSRFQRVGLMKPWSARPKEEAFLLNPAFCSCTLASSICGYSSVRPRGMPFVLSFIVLPLVLHKPTRERLPRDTRTSMPAWLLENSEARVLFYERTIRLKPYTQETILFGGSSNWISLDGGGFLLTSRSESD